MNTTDQNLIIKFLEIIGYTNDKEKFVNSYMQDVEILTYANLRQTLPPDHQKKFDLKMAEAGNDPHKMTSVLNEFFIKEKVSKSFTETLTNELTDLMKSVIGTLNEDQRQKVVAFLEQTASTNKDK